MRGAARKGGPYRDKACPDTAVRVVKADGEREPAKRLNRKAVSTVAGRAGGPARSSRETPAGRGGGGAKGPGHLWWCSFDQPEAVVSGRSRMDALKPSGKSFDISKWQVWVAYRQVKGNQGAPGDRKSVV